MSLWTWLSSFASRNLDEPDKSLVGRVLEPGQELTAGEARNVTAAPAESVIKTFGIRAVVPAGMTVTGEVRSSDGVVIDGVVIGNVVVQGDHRAAVIRQTGHVQGDVNAKVIIVGGHVVGDLTGEFVRLYSTARVHGRIRSARMVIDDGAQLINEDTAIGAVIDGTVVRDLKAVAQYTPTLVGGRDVDQRLATEA